MLKSHRGRDEVQAEVLRARLCIGYRLRRGLFRGFSNKNVAGQRDVRRIPSDGFTVTVQHLDLVAKVFRGPTRIVPVVRKARRDP